MNTSITVTVIYFVILLFVCLEFPYRYWFKKNLYCLSLIFLGLNIFVVGYFFWGLSSMGAGEDHGSAPLIILIVLPFFIAFLNVITLTLYNMSISIIKVLYGITK